jgi:thymidine kinase
VVAADTEVVGIDEGQFFDQNLPAACNTLADSGKRVIVAGLDEDYLGRPLEPNAAAAGSAASRFRASDVNRSVVAARIERND